MMITKRPIRVQWISVRGEDGLEVATDGLYLLHKGARQLAATWASDDLRRAVLAVLEDNLRAVRHRDEVE